MNRAPVPLPALFRFPFLEEAVCSSVPFPESSRVPFYYYLLYLGGSAGE